MNFSTPILRLGKNTVRKLVEKTGYRLSPLRTDPERYFLGFSKLDIAHVIDVGANRGQFVQLAKRWFPQAHFMCFGAFA
ncbi:MAG: hypothetical protein IPJ88_12995 [Myxococcales bacterium]|nr:MAG: hypothetical protein IPJ88_12995 [Myxococcales bacterium]